MSDTRDLSFIAERRGGLASLLGLLLLSEPGPGVAELVADIPALAALGAADGSIASEYERVFLRGVPLYESAFRSDDGQQGGDWLAAVVDSYERVGFAEHRDHPWRIAGVDHLGMELRCLAHLCFEEAAAWRSDTPDQAVSAVEAERTLLAQHIVAWAPVALMAVAAAAGEGPYRPLIDAVAEFLDEDIERLRPCPDFGEPIAVDPLPANYGPARLSRLILAPATAGAWLSLDAIRHSAGAIGSPWRPSDTRTGLRHLIEAAGDTDDLDDVLAPIISEFRGALDVYAGRSEAQPAAGGIWREWATRVSQMLALLNDLSQRRSLSLEPGMFAETLVVSGGDPAALGDAIERVTAELRAAGFTVETPSGHGDGAIPS
jgi:TorA maturation chaperone TorD